VEAQRRGTNVSRILREILYPEGCRSINAYQLNSLPAYKLPGIPAYKLRSSTRILEYLLTYA
jgi:hypothetical protein